MTKKTIIIKPNMDNYQDAMNYIGAILSSGSSVTLDVEKGERKKRSVKQNSAMHLYFKLLADELNNAGYDMKKALKENIDIPWTSESVKSHLWKPIQKSMIEKASTTQLEKLNVSAVYDVLNRHLSEKLGVSIPFPSET